MSKLTEKLDKILKINEQLTNVTVDNNSLPNTGSSKTQDMTIEEERYTIETQIGLYVLNNVLRHGLDEDTFNKLYQIYLMKGMLPDAIIQGGMKCQVHWIHERLEQIFMPENPEGMEYESEDVEGDELNEDDSGYYRDQIKKTLPVDEYGVHIQLSSTKGKTNSMILNKTLLKMMNDIYGKYIK